MTNAQMTKGRFERWAKVRAMLAAIQSHLAAGGRVQVSTHTRSTVYTAKHAGLFSATRSDVNVQQGKQRVSIMYCSVRLIS